MKCYFLGCGQTAMQGTKPPLCSDHYNVYMSEKEDNK